MAVSQVVQIRYNDVRALYEELTRLFPTGGWNIETEMGWYHLTLPRALSDNEIRDVYSKQRHYQTQAERRRRKR